MRDIFDSRSQVVNQQAAEDFVAARKRLREARMRWIEENECPTSYAIVSKDANGNEVSFSTPFQIGKRRYEGEYTEEMKKPVVHVDRDLEKELLEGIGAVFADKPKPGLTVLVAGDETQAFLTGSDADRSPHPEIREGEDYGDYYARVSGAYERQAGAPGTGRPIASDDGLRRSSATDTPGVGSALALSSSVGRVDRPMLDSDADQVRASDESEHGAGSSATSTSSADPGGGESAK